MNIKILFLLLVIPFMSIAQKKGKIYFDGEWEKTTKKNAVYYRNLPLKKKGDLVYIQDFYINGDPQMTGWAHKNNEKKFEGKVTWYYENRQINTIAHYKNGKIEGAVIEYDWAHDDTTDEEYTQIKYEINYLNGERHGANIIYYKGKKHEQYQYEHGQNHGPYIIYSTETGNIIEEGTFKNNLPEGICIEYYGDTRTIESKVHYRKGEMHGRYTKYDKNENIILEEHYVEGKREGEYTFTIGPKNSVYEDRTYEKGMYVDGKKEGIITTYYKTGEKKEECTYHNGEQEGQCTGYSITGEIVYSYYTKNGWTEEGTNQCFETYKARKLVKKEKFYVGSTQLAYSILHLPNGAEEISNYSSTGELLYNGTPSFYSNDDLFHTKEINYYSANECGYVNGIKEITSYTENGYETSHFDRKGTLVTQGTYKGNKPYEGTFYLYPLYANNYEVFVTYKRGVKHGKEYLKHKGKIIAEGNYVYGNRNEGTFVFYENYFELKAAEITIATVSNGQKEGIQQVYNTEKGIITSYYHLKNGKKNGESATYTKDRQLKNVLIYKDDKRYEGNYNTYTDSIPYHQLDRQYNYTYKAGKIYGEKRVVKLQYNDDHKKEIKIIAKGTYKDGKKDQGTFLISDDDIGYNKEYPRPIWFTYKIQHIINGLEEGKQNYYFYSDYKYGNPNMKEGFVGYYHAKADVVDGECVFFHTEGKRYQTIQYINGERVYDDDDKRKLHQKIYYKKGKPYNGFMTDHDGNKTSYAKGKLHGEQIRKHRKKFEYTITEIYKKGVIQSVAYDSIFVNGQNNIKGIYKKGKPFHGYFTVKDFMAVDQYENGEKIFQHSLPVVNNKEEEEEEENTLINLTTKSIYKNGSIYNGYEYVYEKKDSDQIITRSHIKNGEIDTITIGFPRIFRDRIFVLSSKDDGYSITEPFKFSITNTNNILRLKNHQGQILIEQKINKNPETKLQYTYIKDNDIQTQEVFTHVSTIWDDEKIQQIENDQHDNYTLQLFHKLSLYIHKKEYMFAHFKEELLSTKEKFSNREESSNHKVDNSWFNSDFTKKQFVCLLTFDKNAQPKYGMEVKANSDFTSYTVTLYNKTKIIKTLQKVSLEQLHSIYKDNYNDMFIIN
ncbi:toxin-antitoxin system YwqK family antitoxin [Aquimarina sp. AU58]|uniref:toxin-antitoxin system YwqK family antitoxin n=1 Tax=Aquimarina sp. AU58 TaxID=1874112 RepID=UPI000D64335B|nr:hypothetical protein [Aquimarina sp. AU58]